MSAPDTGAIWHDELLGAPGFVLAVDDQDMNLELVDAILGMDGFEVETVSSGAAALAAVARRQPDCIVLDVMMPGMNGYQVLEQLKRNVASAPIPVVLLSAEARFDTDVVHGMECGAIDHLLKPFSGPVLVAKMRAA